MTDARLPIRFAAVAIVLLVCANIVSAEPDGQRAVSAFKGEGFLRTKPIFWEWRGGISKDYTWPTLGIRHGRWKLLVSNELPKTELYDLENDWEEKHDVSQENIEVAKNLRQQLNAWKHSLPLAPNDRCCAQTR